MPLVWIRELPLEPDAQEAGGGAASTSEVGRAAIALSQAISLKRIADALERLEDSGDSPPSLSNLD